MTIINPTPTVKIANPPRVEGTQDSDQLRRLGYLAGDVARRFHTTGSEQHATLGYVYRGDNFDAAKDADSAAYLVASLLACLAHELADGELSSSCLDGTESKQFRKGYKAALDQVATELFQAADIRL
ncbi:hypothetical protein [Agromyces sp. NPDC055658]